MDDVSQTQFHLEEYKALKAEFIEQGKKYDQLKLALIGGVGAYYAWMITHTFVNDPGKSTCLAYPSYVLYVLLAIPIFVSLAATVVASFILRHFDLFGAYFRTVETYLGRDEIGWQHFLERTFSLPAPANLGKRVELAKRVLLRDPFWLFVLAGCFLLSGVGVLWSHSGVPSC